MDATVAGGVAHLLNHSCAPNCYSRTVTFADPVTQAPRDHVIIYAARWVPIGGRGAAKHACLRLPLLAWRQICEHTRSCHAPINPQGHPRGCRAYVRLQVTRGRVPAGVLQPRRAQCHMARLLDVRLVCCTRPTCALCTPPPPSRFAGEEKLPCNCGVPSCRGFVNCPADDDCEAAGAKWVPPTELVLVSGKAKAAAA